MSAYTDATKVSNYLKRSLTAEETAILSVLADAATEWIDSYLETNYQEAEESTREYDGCEREIIIDPCKEVSAVKTLDSYGAVLNTLTATDYKMYPLNKTIKRSVRSRIGEIGGSIAGIQVTAKFTSLDTAVPQSVVLAATMLVADYMQSDDYRVKSEETEGWKVAYDSLPQFTDKVLNLLAPYRRLVL